MSARLPPPIRLARALPLGLALTAAAGRPAAAGVVSGQAPTDVYQPRRIAVLIGVQDYADPALAGLRYAEADAQDLAAALGDPDTGGFDRVFVITGARQTSADGIEHALAVATADLQRDDTFLLYLSGHGSLTLDPLEGSRLWFLPSDGRLDDPARTGLAIADLEARLSSLPARRRVLVMDTCHNGRAAPPVGGLASRARIDAGTDALLQGFRGEPPAPRGLLDVSEREARLFAAQYHQPAMEDPALQNGVYTHFLVEALTSARAAADLDGDGLVDVAEAHDHARDRTIAHTGGLQVPRAEHRIVGREEIFLAGAPTARGSAERALVGAYTELLAQARLIIDGVPRGSALGLTAVEPGRRTIELQDAAGKRLGTTTVRLDPGESLNLDGLVSTRHARWDLSIGGIAHSGTASRYLPAAAGELELSWVDPLRAPAWLSADLHLRAGLGRGQVAEQTDFPVSAGAPAAGLSLGLRRGPVRLGAAVEAGALWRSFRDFAPGGFTVEPRLDAVGGLLLGPRLRVDLPWAGLHLRADSRWMGLQAAGSPEALWQHGLALGATLGR